MTVTAGITQVQEGQEQLAAGIQSVQEEITRLEAQKEQLLADGGTGCGTAAADRDFFAGAKAAACRTGNTKGGAVTERDGTDGESYTDPAGQKENSSRQGRSWMPEKRKSVCIVRNLRAGEEKIAQAKEQLAAGERQISQAQQQLADGEAQIGQAKAQIADGRKQLAGAKATLADGRRSFLPENNRLWMEKRTPGGKDEIAERDGTGGRLEGIQKRKPESREKLADAKEEIADGEKELEDLKVPDWYVWGRDQVTSTENYGQDAVRITNIGKFFPVIFFLVAALVSLTTMTSNDRGTASADRYPESSGIRRRCDRGKISCLRTDVYHLRCICRSAAR